MEKIILNGIEYDLDAVVNLMDDELRELIASYHLMDDQLFVNAYVQEHEAKFGEAFVIN